MTTVAIITEYNPFHMGHEYQIKRVREIFGEDTAIIAIMSGNFTQRGEPAIADKTLRSKAAVECGVNLVLELPFPYSISSAEFFASAGVHIADELGVVDYLVFGSELGESDELMSVAENMSSDAFLNKLSLLMQDEKYSNVGYPRLCEVAYKEIYGESCISNLFSPNNILAIEYIKSLKKINSKIIPYTIQRVGAGYNEDISEKECYQSASAIRGELYLDSNSALEYLPNKLKSIYSDAISSGKMPSDISRLDTAVISYFRLNSPVCAPDIQDAGGGLYNRLYALSKKANSISSLASMAETKKYTNARIKRAIWSSYFGVTSSDVRTLPGYTQVLAMDTLGMSLLQRMKKVSGIYVITKPSAYKSLPCEVVRQKELCNKADSVFGLLLKSPNSGDFASTFTPYVKK